MGNIQQLYDQQSKSPFKGHRHEKMLERIIAIAENVEKVGNELHGDSPPRTVDELRPFVTKLTDAVMQLALEVGVELSTRDLLDRMHGKVHSHAE